MIKRSILFLVGIITIILGINETTIDLYDHIGKFRYGTNYWLAWCAIISGVIILFILLSPQLINTTSVQLPAPKTLIKKR